MVIFSPLQDYQKIKYFQKSKKVLLWLSIIFHFHAASKLPDSSWDCAQKCKNICRKVILTEHLTRSRKCKISHGTAYYQNIPCPALQRQEEFVCHPDKENHQDSGRHTSLWNDGGQKCPSQLLDPGPLSCHCVNLESLTKPPPASWNTSQNKSWVMITLKYISFKIPCTFER